MSNLTREQKIVFAIAPTGQGDGEGPVLLLGVPRGAWDYMKDSKTHTFDLTSLGLPIKLILYGAKDHREAMRAIEDHMKKQGIPYDDQRGADFAIKPKP
jgi:hypothetical protein